jgi:hypothetical protein
MVVDHDGLGSPSADGPATRKAAGDESVGAITIIVAGTLLIPALFTLGIRKPFPGRGFWIR